MQTPSSTAKKTFNLQKAQNLTVAEDQPRELNLDFGYRSWRLRAADAAEARRWLVLLEAGRLTAGNAEEGDASESDMDDSASVCSVPSGSSTTAESLHSVEPTTPKFGIRDKEKADKVQPSWSTPAIADTLEVNTEELDRQFDSWLPFANEDVSLQISTPSTSFVCDGLSRALHGHWLRLCEVCAAAMADDKLRLEASGKRPAVAAERAVTTLLQGQSESHAARESLDNFLGEYLLRILQRMELWVARYDPSADEVATVAKWWLFQAEPALLPFCQRAERFAGEKLEHSEQAVISIEKLLLREWESRSCEEASGLCSQIFEGHYAEEAGNVDLAQLLRSLQEAADAWQTWRSHSAACNRAASVLIAMLNAALRSQHAASRMLLSEAEKLSRTSRRKTFPKMIQMGRQALQEFQKAGACSDGKGKRIPEEVLAAAAQDAVQLAIFCSHTSDSLEGWGSTKELCHEVLLAFESAFQTEVSSLTRALTTVHHHYNRQFLKVHSFSSLLRKDHSGGTGILTSATAAWIEFLRNFTGNSQVPSHAGPGQVLGTLRERVGASIVELLASAWVQNFVRAPPPLSVWGTRLFTAFAADEAALASLAPDSKELGKFRQMVETMRGFLEGNAQSRWQELGKAENVLQKLLAEEQGRALTHALWQTATR